jgi:hypothetical protein
MLWLLAAALFFVNAARDDRLLLEAAVTVACTVQILLI